MPTRPLRVPEQFPLVPDPPYDLQGCRSFLFALPAPIAELQQLVDTTYQWAQPDLHVQATAPVVLLAFMDVASASGADPAQGHFAYREASWFVPVRVDRPGEPSRYAFHAPFLYPDEGMAVAAGREIYGLPKKPGEVTVPGDGPFWNGTQSLRVRALAAKTLNGTAWTQKQVVRVTSQPQAPLGGALGALLGLLFPGVGLTLLDVDIVSLKQFPDVTPGVPPRSISRAVVHIDAPLQTTANVRLADPLKVTVRTEQLATEPIRDVLGLGLNTTPLFAAGLDVDFSFATANVLHEEPGDPVPSGDRVLVLGGGLAGLTAAYHLTDPARSKAYQVTVVQQGHMLGGKGASWRNAAQHDRIEEHGVHVIFGFYKNFLKLMEEVYGELTRDPNLFPSSYLEAFKPIGKVVLNDGQHDYTVFLPENPAGWDLDEADTVVEALQTFKLWLEETFELSVNVLGNVGATLTSPVAHDLIGFATALFVGIWKDTLAGKTRADLDAEDFRDWLKRHDGLLIPGRSWDGPASQVPYDGIFSYPGPILGQGAISAWVAAWGMARLLTSYRGSPYYFMDAGMGEAVFAPLYELLRARGVRFEFMSLASQVEVTGGRVSKVIVTRQETIHGGPDAYQPLIRVKQTPTWPQHPDATQMTNTGIGGADPYSDATTGSTGQVTLLDGTHFDHVVCAMPAPVTASVLTGALTPELAAIANIETVATMHLQAWTTDTLANLGWKWGQTALGAFEQPLNSMMTCDRILHLESWGAGGPQGCLYLSGPLVTAWSTDPTDPAQRAAAEASAQTIAQNFMQAHFAKLLPGADDGFGGFDFAYEQDRYVRANIDHWQRFTLATPGGLANRPWPVVPGVANLFLAGDWTRNGIDIPCMEATTVSAMLAVQGITGDDLGVIEVWPTRP